MNELATIVSDTIYGVREAFNSITGDPKVFEKEAGFAVQLLSASDYALGIARGNQQSVINAVTNIASIGISLNPAKKQAYLVPRDGKICLDISYMGLLDLAIASGSILWGQAELVYAADGFELNGFDRPPTHKRNPFSRDRGELIGVYVVVKTPDGDYLTTTMPVDEVFGIRDRSSAWKAWIAKKKSCPWVTDEGEMVRKTVIKRAYKTWPKTDRLDKAVHYLNTDGGEGLDLAPAVPPPPPPPPAGPTPYPADTFAKAMPIWRGLIADGKKSADQIIATVQTKHTLSAEQVAAIRAPVKPATVEDVTDVDPFVADMERAEAAQNGGTA